MTRQLPARCDFDGRFIPDAYAASWAWFAAEDASFCEACGRGLPGGHEERQQALRERANPAR